MKFIVGYFSVIGLIMFPWLGKVLALFYLYFLLQRWHNPKLVVLIGISAFLSYFIFGIVFAFSFPFWVVLGIVATLYGYSIGLFRKVVRGEESSDIDRQDIMLPKISKKQKILSGFALIVALIGVAWVVGYGFNSRPCVYTYKNSVVPPLLLGKKIILKKTAYLVRGTPPDSCEWSDIQVFNEIVHSDAINNVSVGKHYYESQGRRVFDLKTGKIFHLKNIVSRSRRGLGSIFSSSPIYFLLLQDELGAEYKVSLSSLGYDEKEAIFRFHPESTEVGFLSWGLLSPYFYPQI